MTKKRDLELPMPTEAELDILNVLWDRGPSTVPRRDRTDEGHARAGREGQECKQTNSDPELAVDDQRLSTFSLQYAYSASRTGTEAFR